MENDFFFNFANCNSILLGMSHLIIKHIDVKSNLNTSKLITPNIHYLNHI